MSSLAVLSQICPSDHFSATFMGTVDKVFTGAPSASVVDPEQKYFKEILGFRDNDIQHITVDAMTVFNDTYGLDFFASVPNDMNDRFFENVKIN